MRSMRVLLGDDHALVLGGIKSLLQSRYEVVGAAQDGRQLVDAALRLKPDFVILDVSMPQLNGLEAARQIRLSLPSAKLIFLSMHANPMYLRKAFDVGASAYVLKAGVVEELVEAMRQVSEGNTYVSPGFGPDVLETLWDRSGKPSVEGEKLTDRQREILQLIAEGQLSKQIADALDISIKTVEFHRGRIMARLGVHSVAELVRTAVEQGLIPARTSNDL
jgi:DNA-binding NarL/FixJ family response regulator